jgi:phosphoribosylformylglycinamidine synthase I
MKFGIIQFPGSNCDQDMIYFLSGIMGFEATLLWHKENDLKGCDVLILPGGFSYGDYLRSGAIARFSPIMEEVTKHASEGGIVIGICNGFQVLCESHLLPGALLHNTSNKFICKNIWLKTHSRNNPFTSEVPEGKILKIPIAHGEGRFYADEKTIQTMQRNEQIIFTYCDENGVESESSNPNGSLLNIAGICNAEKNVFGMMPHPERAGISESRNTDGRMLFTGFAKMIAHLN